MSSEHSYEHLTAYINNLPYEPPDVAKKVDAFIDRTFKDKSKKPSRDKKREIEIKFTLEGAEAPIYTHGVKPTSAAWALRLIGKDGIVENKVMSFPAGSGPFATIDIPVRATLERASFDYVPRVDFFSEPKLLTRRFFLISWSHDAFQATYQEK